MIQTPVLGMKPNCFHLMIDAAPGRALERLRDLLDDTRLGGFLPVFPAILFCHLAD